MKRKKINIVNRYHPAGQLKQTKCKANIKQSTRGSLTCYLHLTKEQKDGLLLQKGTLRDIRIVVL